MGLTITKNEDKDMVKRCGLMGKIVTGKITFDTYHTDGESLDLSAEFPGELHTILFENSGGYFFEYDRTNKKVKAMYFDYNGAADGAAIEYPNDTALTISTYFMAIGK
jgi:hypothetical protein